MTGELHYPRLRAMAVCPLCGMPKQDGALVCWPCYRQHALRYGNPLIEQQLADLERDSAALAERASL